MLFPPQTARLALRAWREEDRPAFAAMNADARVMEFYPAPLTDAESQALMERIRDEFSTDGFGLYAVERLSDNELLGYVGLHRVTSSGELAGQIEIGWRLRRETRHPGTHLFHLRRKPAFAERDETARHGVRRGVRPPCPAGRPSPAEARPLSHPDRTMKKSAAPKGRGLLFSGGGIISIRTPPCREYRPTRRPRRP